MCTKEKNPPLWFVGDHGSVRGVANMKKEILARGPIGCGIDATNAFEKYAGGIYSQSKKDPQLNHEISIAGWGSENGVDYWIGRNSWGTYWGEDGWFRIKMTEDNLGVTTDCDWGVPIVPKGY